VRYSLRPFRHLQRCSVLEIRPRMAFMPLSIVQFQVANMALGIMTAAGRVYVSQIESRFRSQYVGLYATLQDLFSYHRGGLFISISLVTIIGHWRYVVTWIDCFSRASFQLIKPPMSFSNLVNIVFRATQTWCLFSDILSVSMEC